MYVCVCIYAYISNNGHSKMCNKKFKVICLSLFILQLYDLMSTQGNCDKGMMSQKQQRAG